MFILFFACSDPLPNFSDVKCLLSDLRFRQVKILILNYTNLFLLLRVILIHLSYRKNIYSRTSLVVQWIRICLPMRGIQVQSLVQEDFHVLQSN